MRIGLPIGRHPPEPLQLRLGAGRINLVFALDPNSEAVVSDPIFHVGVVRIGRFDMGPRHPRWNEPNRTYPTPKITFNLVPTRIRLGGHESVIANPSQVMLFNGSHEYTRTRLEDQGAASTWIEFPHDAISHHANRDVFDPEDPLRPFRVPQLPCPPACRALHRALLNRLNDSMPEDSIVIEEAAMDLVSRVLATASQVQAHRQRPSTRRAHAQLVHRAIEFLVAHHREPILLADIARAAHASPFHFARVFHRVTGITVHECVECLRLASALEQLAEHRGNYWRLAKQTGFADAAHMSTVFRKRLGLPPMRINDALAHGSLRRIRESILGAGSPFRPTARAAPPRP